MLAELPLVNLLSMFALKFHTVTSVDMGVGVECTLSHFEGHGSWIVV